MYEHLWSSKVRSLLLIQKRMTKVATLRRQLTSRHWLLLGGRLSVGAPGRCVPPSVVLLNKFIISGKVLYPIELLANAHEIVFFSRLPFLHDDEQLRPGRRHRRSLRNNLVDPSEKYNRAASRSSKYVSYVLICQA